MKIRYQADNDLNKSILRGLVRSAPEIDFRSAQAARLDGVPDQSVLRMAALDRRVLVTHDLNTIPKYFRSFAGNSGIQSPGVFVIPQSLRVGVAVECLWLAWAVSEAEEWAERVCILPSFVSIIHSRQP